MQFRKYVLALAAFSFFFTLRAGAQDEVYHPELEWHTISTKHFFVNYHDGEERTAQVVAKVAEDIYGPVTALYNHEPDSKVSFVIKDYDDYSNGAAYFFDNKIEIWASALDFDLRGSHNWLRNVVTHEFTHIVQIQTSMKFGRKVPGIYLQWLGYENERRPDVLYGYPNKIVSYPLSGYVVPSWFAEGTAQFNRKELGYDNWDSHRDMILRMYALDNNMLTWNEMSVFGKTSLGNESSYNAGFAFVHYLSDRYGNIALRKISYNLSTLTELTIDGAIKRAVGKSGGEVYDEWRESLRQDYARRTQSIKQNLVTGDIIANVGFGNFYPQFSPDGKSIAYISNKEADYFGLSGLYLYDVATKKERLLKFRVRDNFSWTPDGKRIIFGRTSDNNPHWSNVFDLYSYDIAKDEETRLTHGARAYSPAVSPDGSTVLFVASRDGTINLYAMDIDGSHIRRLTNYDQGDQVFNPKWSPDGKQIIFDYSIKEGRDIAIMPAQPSDSTAGDHVTFLVATKNDERNAVFTPDGSSIIYASDSTGIFNLYFYNIASKETHQITNVLGGAFMPTVNAAGQISFATYTSTGYKIAFLNQAQPLEDLTPYSSMPPATVVCEVKTDPKIDSAMQAFDWQKLRASDDRNPPQEPVKDYPGIATSLTFVPFLRLDNYNTHSTGLQDLKPGLYAFSYDVLERYGFFAGAAANIVGDRDLFFNFDYRGKIPGLSALGLEPALSVAGYNVTRSTNPYIYLGADSLQPGLTYNLIEFDIALAQRIFMDGLNLEVRFSHSWYNADLGSFTDPESNPANQVIQSSSNPYFNGNEISATLDYSAIAPSRTSDINPIGRKIKIRYSYQFSEFDPNGEDSVNSSGTLVPEYTEYKFHSLEASWKEMMPLPGWSHTLTLAAHGGAILGQPVDDFFDFYIGGLDGMRGYPFYSLGGNKYLYGSAGYRFPMLEHIDTRLAQIYFDKLYGSFFGDAGDVWNGVGGPTGLKFKRDAGVELRLQAFSYYSYPTSIFFSATYGLDAFTKYIPFDYTTVDYGKEWNYHFGILFSFDLDGDAPEQSRIERQ